MINGERPRFAHWFRCRACGNRFNVVRLTPDPQKVRVPRCPRKKCTGKVKPSFMPDVGLDVAAGIAPPQVGAAAVRAYDIAMETAAQNAGLTNLNDKPAYGENSVPKLPPHLQHKVDNFWGAPPGQPKMVKRRVDLSSIFGDRAVAAQKASPVDGLPNQIPLTIPLASSVVNNPGSKPPVTIIAGDRT